MNSVQLFFATVFSAAAGYAAWLYLPVLGIPLIDGNRAIACVIIALVFLAFLMKMLFPLLARQPFLKDLHLLHELDVSEQKDVAPKEFKPLGIDEEPTFAKGDDIFCTTCGEKVGKGKRCKSCGAQLR